MPGDAVTENFVHLNSIGLDSCGSASKTAIKLYA